MILVVFCTLVGIIQFMNLYEEEIKCQNCKVEITEKISKYSELHFGYPLCKSCQDWLKDIADTTSATNESISVYFALKKRNVPAQLEKSDGFKTIDIAVPHAKVNIEVDGGHHIYNVKQAMSDLKRTLHSYKKGYSTLRIPNSLAKHDLDQAADLITEFLKISRDSKNVKVIEDKKEVVSTSQFKQKAKKDFIYLNSPNYTTDQNFFFPALSELLKKFCEPQLIDFNKDVLKLSILEKTGIEIRI